MTDLYRHNGGAPAVLPERAYDADNNAFTPPYVDDDLAMLGFVLAPPKPDDTDAQTAEWDAENEAWIMVDRPPPPSEPMPTAADIDAERDRRIEAGFTFAGKAFQARPADRENILGAASLAHMAMTLQNKKPGDLRWHGGEDDFVWIAADNSLVPMDAPTVMAFGQVAANHKSAHTFAARALKDLDEIPADFADDRHWPDA
ncbi:DUF4376 domain-containing protein [Aureimonas sp. ME7]|uniref:DUF4376 domain-containing protein n=1 Tax=Aureimonas sp. ME7 TaxID=2744252 RepID=UPI0015FAE5EF|nr:DUF4376 domain-containing protein [Aureimonas sp. ME7]